MPPWGSLSGFVFTSLLVYEILSLVFCHFHHDTSKDFENPAWEPEDSEIIFLKYDSLVYHLELQLAAH